MQDTWGKLKDKEKQIIGLSAKKLTDSEISERFALRNDTVVFRILRKTDRAMAGVLDIDRLEDELEPDTSDIEEKSEVEEVIQDQALKEEIDDYEISEISLISPEDFDYEVEITNDDKKAAKPIDKLLAEVKEYFAHDNIIKDAASETEQEAEMLGLPSVIDHRTNQSPVKSQGSIRGTCVAHASMGLIEAFGHISDDLSEQYTHYKFNESLNRPHNENQGLRTTDAAPFLARSDGRVCLEADWPYIPNQATINAMVANGTYAPPQAAIDNQTYGYGGYKIITDNGLTGESIKNTRYLEALLYQNYNIVIGTWVSWDDKDNNGILDPVLDNNNMPVGRGGHAMVVVGYNRSSQYFIVKNSWGPGWGHNGYAYLHYNYIRSCFKYGFVVDNVVPPALTILPRKLIQAPYNTQKISRSRLRAAILFFKTSRGRYAVCEAYAGYNLYLRNLRVYNVDGSLHLERDNLVIRGTYLCDIDSARETSLDADFWWEAVRPGVNYLVPRNNAGACVAFNLAAMNAQQISAMTLDSAPIPSCNLDYAVVAGRTTANRRFKMLVHAKPSNKLQISYLELYDSRGRRYRYATNLYIPSSWTYNLDTQRTGGARYADIWWHVISDGVGFMERYSTARIQLVWNL